jgi:hypothetical protein
MSTSIDQALLSSASNKNVSYRTCEAYACIKKATIQIRVNVGVLGNVNLNLCKDCVSKFSDHVATTEKGLENHSLSKEGEYSNEYISTA